VQICHSYQLQYIISRNFVVSGNRLNIDCCNFRQSKQIAAVIRLFCYQGIFSLRENSSSATISYGIFFIRFFKGLGVSKFNSFRYNSFAKLQFTNTPPSLYLPLAPTFMYVSKFTVCITQRH
jgi:hypothetical protein